MQNGKSGNNFLEKRKDFWKNKKVLITGCTGFKGSWLTEWLILLGARVEGYSNGIPTDPSLFKILKLQDRISNFCKEREWDKFHSPKNLAISICIEAAELLENFQWDKDNLEIEDKKKERISQEIADVLIYSIRLCEVLDLDPIKISNNKIDKNGEKYPVNLSKGISDKYKDL